MSIKLESIEFTSAPTKTQLENAIRDFSDFTNKCLGSMLAEGHYTVTEQFVGATFNALIHLKQAQDAIAGNANLALPQQGQGPRVVR